MKIWPSTWNTYLVWRLNVVRFFILNRVYYIHVRVKKESDLLKLTFDDGS